jgi:DNA-binding GntR family transcriptional regulator
MDESEQIERGSSLATLVTDRLRDYILGGAFASGTRLVQGELAKRWGVSRMPVRVAMERLRAEGLLVPDGSGMRVVAIDVDDIEAGYRLNSVVTSMAARRAAQKIQPDEIAELEHLHRQLADAIAAGDTDLVARLNWRFHTVINKAARSTRLESMLRFASSMIPHVAFELLEDWPRTAMPDHEQLIAALTAHDAEAAERIMARHVHIGAEGLVDVINQRITSARAAERSGTDTSALGE